MKKITEEDKTLMKLELCHRLPYGLKDRVVATCVDTDYGEKEFDVELDKIDIGDYEMHVTALGDDDFCDYIEESQTMGEPWTISDFKPYLRPMDSMTEEEYESFMWSSWWDMQQ